MKVLALACWKGSLGVELGVAMGGCMDFGNV
jgi:hypothetical protein